MEISEILKKYNTDKNKETHDSHCYGKTYDNIFKKYKGKIDLLEIGIQYGESLLAWREYFPKANITGVDIADNVANKQEGINYIFADIKDFKGKEYDLVIDDGSHILSDVLWVVENIRLKKGGTMIIEDCQEPEIWLGEIKKISPYKVKAIDLRQINGRYDDYLIILQYETK